MNQEISDYNNILVVDHELLEDISIPNEKRRVSSLKEAKIALLEGSFNAVVFLSLLEESNEIEIFVNNLRSHPKFNKLPVFCEHGLTLALPKALQLISFNEASLQDLVSDDEIDDTILNQNNDIGDIGVEVKSFLDELKDLTAKSFVIFEQNLDDKKSRKQLIDDYLLVLKSEIV